MLRVLALEETVQGYLGYGVQGVGSVWKPVWQRDPQARSRGQWRGIGPNTKDCQFRSCDSWECLTFRKTDKTDL